MNLVDAHTHIRPGQEEAAIQLAQQGLWQLVAATNPDQCQPVSELAKAHPRIIPTFGMSPWQPHQYPLDCMDQWLAQAPIIGEIGLDTVWSSAPMDIQRQSFLHQLQTAVKLNKPVMLHTKGAEAEIAQWLRKYTPPLIIVHWYSGPAEQLADYVDLDCYFTLGPDIRLNPAVREVCRQVPLPRLLTETDGTESVAWGTGEACSMADVPQVLRGILGEAAMIKGVAEEEMHATVYDNLMRVLDHIAWPIP
ncbi:MAG: TatD family hydrolase [Bacillota bacterium]